MRNLQYIFHIWQFQKKSLILYEMKHFWIQAFLKVRKSRNNLWCSQFFPKYEQKITILSTYFLKRMCSGKSVFVRFFEKIEGNINCSRDFLTFILQKDIRRFKTQFSFLGDFIVHFLHTTTFHLGLQQLQSFQDLNFRLAIKTIVCTTFVPNFCCNDELRSMMSWVGFH